MLKIQSLLNPMADGNVPRLAPSTRAAARPYTPQSSTPTVNSRPNTPNAYPAKRQKLVKDAAVFIRGPITGPNDYPPYECSDTSPYLCMEQSTELARKHRLYRIHPNALVEDKIADFVRHIPYSSEKKSLFSKTGRDAFHGKLLGYRSLLLRPFVDAQLVFQYTFVVPDDPLRRTWVVMWDYQIGLVRVTPFFKALNHGKVWTEVFTNHQDRH